MNEILEKKVTLAPSAALDIDTSSGLGELAEFAAPALQFLESINPTTLVTQSSRIVLNKAIPEANNILADIGTKSLSAVTAISEASQITSPLTCLSNEVLAFCESPLSYARNLASEFLASPFTCLRRFCSFSFDCMAAIPAGIAEYFRSFFKSDSTEQKTRLSESDPRDNVIPFFIIPAWVNKFVLGGGEPSGNTGTQSAARANSESTRDEEDEYFRAKKKEKGFFDALREGLEAIAQAVLERNRKIEEDEKTEDPVELRERLEHEAEVETRKATTLRPELAILIHEPDTSFNLEGAFAGVKSVDALIAQAEREAAECVTDKIESSAS